MSMQTPHEGYTRHELRGMPVLVQHAAGSFQRPVFTFLRSFVLELISFRCALALYQLLQCRMTTVEP